MGRKGEIYRGNNYKIYQDDAVRVVYGYSPASRGWDGTKWAYNSKRDQNNRHHDRGKRIGSQIPKKELAPEFDNLVIGSSIIGKLEIDKSIPIDSAIHAYRGSTTNEKVKVLSKYDPKKIWTSVIQDGTNNLLKHNSKFASDKFLEQEKLIDLCIEKFDPDVCEVLPLKNVQQYRD